MKEQEIADNMSNEAHKHHKKHHHKHYKPSQRENVGTKVERTEDDMDEEDQRRAVMQTDAHEDEAREQQDFEETQRAVQHKQIQRLSQAHAVEEPDFEQ